MKQILTVFLLILTLSQSIACSISQDIRTEEEQIKSSKLAFIGEIIKIDNKEITFKIEKDLKNVLKEGDVFVFTRSPPSTCIISDFDVGQKWHFSGDSTTNPTWAILKRHKRITP
jgi:hypothetical protein